MDSSSLRLMAIFAHPDDEAFGTGGTLARYAAEGCQVYLVTATRGEAGQIAEPDMATRANLPQVREQELRCACAAYGIEPPIFMDYLDGQLPIVHQGQAVGKLVRLLREIRPQVVITFGPEGIYGHYDHIAIHRWATIAAKLAADPDCFPDLAGGGCQPHAVSKLYYRVLLNEELALMSDGAEAPTVMMDGVPFEMVGYPLEQISTYIDISHYQEAKLRGIDCHVTQIGRENPFRQMPADPAVRALAETEHYVLARSTVPRVDTPESDLFAGLRG